MEPILIPAYPSVLRAGLPCVCRDGSGRRDPAILLWVDADRPTQWVVQWLDPHKIAGRWPLSWLDLDVRLRCVRDELTTAMWRRLRPDEPEPLTAPTWVCSLHPDELPLEDEEDDVTWFLGPDGGSILFIDADDPCADAPGLRRVHGLAKLARCGGPDRDLLALAACAAAVLS